MTHKKTYGHCTTYGQKNIIQKWVRHVTKKGYVTIPAFVDTKNDWRD